MLVTFMLTPKIISNYKGYNGCHSPLPLPLPSVCTRLDLTRKYLSGRQTCAIAPGWQEGREREGEGTYLGVVV